MFFKYFVKSFKIDVGIYTETLTTVSVNTDITMIKFYDVIIEK